MKDRLAEVVDEVVITGQNTGEKMCSCESDVVDETCSSESYDACGDGGTIVKKASIVLNKTQGHYLPLCFSFRFCCFKSNRYSCLAFFCSLLTVFRIRFCSSCCNFSAS